MIGRPWNLNLPCSAPLDLPLSLSQSAEESTKDANIDNPMGDAEKIGMCWVLLCFFD